MTADACSRAVVAGPVEATAIGNILVQAMATGDVKSLADARAIVREQLRREALRAARDGEVGRGVRAVQTAPAERGTAYQPVSSLSRHGLDARATTWSSTATSTSPPSRPGTAACRAPAAQQPAVPLHALAARA